MKKISYKAANIIAHMCSFGNIKFSSSTIHQLCKHQGS